MKKFFFIHIGKTAGSSFDAFLKRNFNGEEHCEQYLDSDCISIVDCDRLIDLAYISEHLKLEVFAKNKFSKEEYFLVTFLKIPLLIGSLI